MAEKPTSKDDNTSDSPIKPEERAAFIAALQYSKETSLVVTSEFQATKGILRKAVNAITDSPIALAVLATVAVFGMCGVIGTTYSAILDYEDSVNPPKNPPPCYMAPANMWHRQGPYLVCPRR